MATTETNTLTVTIDAPFDTVANELADPIAQTEWGTEFFAGRGERRGDGTVIAEVPMMGGPVQFRIDAVKEHGIFDLYLAPVGTRFGPPLPVRLVRNGDGVDVLWTLGRMPGAPQEVWEASISSMARELENLRHRGEPLSGGRAGR
jgi:hypothetical protein